MIIMTITQGLTRLFIYESFPWENTLNKVQLLLLLLLSSSLLFFLYLCFLVCFGLFELMLYWIVCFFLDSDFAPFC